MKLPDVTSDRRYVDALIAYDTVEDQYKVLCVKMFDRKMQQQQGHFVCTLSSSQKQEWRMIENRTWDNYECVFFGHICIDGDLYYRVDQSRIVRFDVRAEKIEIIKTPKKSHLSIAYNSTLINYNGKLGRLVGSCTNNLVTLWVLEDVEKREWSSMTHALPYQCGSIHRVFVCVNLGCMRVLIWCFVHHFVFVIMILIKEIEKSGDPRNGGWWSQRYPWVRCTNWLYRSHWEY